MLYVLLKNHNFSIWRNVNIFAVVWDVKPCRLRDIYLIVASTFYLEDKGNILLFYVDMHLPDFTTPYSMKI